MVEEGATVFSLKKEYYVKKWETFENPPLQMRPFTSGLTS